ncbi:MAG TPA: Arc family DNA binding domain-containing protein [Planctomycetaceae bacterium]|nr:Arc family DNA binding domain-containing protein [Planctomycetaceae bacterium]
MAKRDSFLLRLDPRVMEAVRQWADDEMRSINGQIEYLLRGAVKEAGRLPKKSDEEGPSAIDDAESDEG